MAHRTARFMVALLTPVVARTSAYVKVANFTGLYRHARSGRYYGYKKLSGIRRERSLGTCDRKIAERRLKDRVGNLDKVDAEVEKSTPGQLIGRYLVVTGGMAHNTHRWAGSRASAECGASYRQDKHPRSFQVLPMREVDEPGTIYRLTLGLVPR